MQDKSFALVFKGQLQEGKSLPEVKQRLQKLFKTTAEKVDRMFSGQPVVLKHNLNQTTAEKYKKALLQAGALCELRAQKQTEAVTKKTTKATTEIKSTGTSDWDILPPGSVLSEKKEVHHITPDTSHLDISPQQGYIVEPDQSLAPPPPDVSHLKLDPR